MIICASIKVHIFQYRHFPCVRRGGWVINTIIILICLDYERVRCDNTVVFFFKNMVKTLWYKCMLNLFRRISFRLDQVQELFASLRIVSEHSQHGGRDGLAVDLLYASHDHAHVPGYENKMLQRIAETIAML